jgi:ATP-binding cassette, subfamily B (MDR/TAP), member 7
MLASRLCLRAVARPQVLPVSSLYAVGLRVAQAATWPKRRVFVSTPRHRKDDARIRTVEAETAAKQVPAENVKPESVEKERPADPTAANGPLLSEQTKSNKEQRKADWRIIKDMSQYLWPKDDLGVRLRVGLSVALLVGAKVGISCLQPPTYMLIAYIGSQCPSAILFQDDRRQHEH